MQFNRLRARLPKVAKVPWPCIVCGSECREACTKKKNVRSLECNVCSGWCHEVCASLTPDAFDYFEQTTSTYMCGRCIGSRRNTYSYDFALKRLKQSPTAITVVNETQLMSLYGSKEKQCGPDFDPLTVGAVDRVAVSVLRRFHPAKLDRHVPLEAYGDGNCCYLSVATALFGAQTYHEYVRLMTALEMIEYRDHYDVNSPSYVGALRDDRIDTPSYPDLINDATKLGTPVSLMHLYGISAAFGINIHSYIPPSVTTGYNTSPYEVMIVGRGCRRQADAKLTLMWTPMTAPGPGQPFVATHIVLLAPRPSALVNVDSNAVLSDAERSESRLERTASMTSSCFNTFNFDRDLSPGDSTTKRRFFPRTSSPNAVSTFRPAAGLSVDFDQGLAEMDSEENMDAELGVPNAGTPLPHPTGLTTSEVLDILLKDSTHAVYPQVPSGAKENVFYVIDNTNNAQRHRDGRNNIFDDDCGVWKSSSARSMKHPYLLEDNKQTRLFWVASMQKYCREKKSGGRRFYEPYEPQPSPADIVTLTRYYVTLASDPNFKRRVTWIESTATTGKMSKRAIVEYFGQHSSSTQQHGNQRHPVERAPYVRTKALTMNRIGEQLKTQRPLDVYNERIAADDISVAPRDSRVVRNKKASLDRERRVASGKTSCHTFGDEIQQVLSLAQSDDFVRMVVISNRRVPAVILYTDRQIRELKSFCFDRQNGSVWGFDKTFNVSELFVTPTVYKNPALVRRRTNEQPIFMGPLFLHGQSDVEAYGQFVGHLSLKLMDCNSQQLPSKQGTSVGLSHISYQSDIQVDYPTDVP